MLESLSSQSFCIFFSSLLDSGRGYKLTKSITGLTKVGVGRGLKLAKSISVLKRVGKGPGYELTNSISGLKRVATGLAIFTFFVFCFFASNLDERN